MLSGNNNIPLIRYQNINEEYVFFTQRWREILESKTLDMYQYNILNSCVACDEFADVIEKTLNGVFTSRQNVDDCKAEALEIVKEDFILEKHNKPLKNTLLRVLSSRIDSKSKSENLDDKNGNFYTSLNRIKFQLKDPLRQLKRQFLEYILEDLKEAIDNSDNEIVNTCIGALVSQCIFQGWSAKGLTNLSQFFETTESSTIKWQKFSEKIKSDTLVNFEIYCSVKIESRRGLSIDEVKDTISSIGLEIINGSEIIQQKNENVDFCSKINSETTYVLTRVDLTDPYSAVLRAINLLNSKLSVATFYNTIDPWIAISPQIVVLNTTDGQSENLKLTDIFKTYDYVDSNNSVFEDTKQIILNPEMDDVKNKINSVFAYTNLSRSSVFQETKFITLWIALESVMRTGQYQDIITHIKAVLPEILATRYVYRIVRNFAEDCIRCKMKKCDELDLDFEQEDKKALVKKIILIFRDATKYTILLEKCKRCKLLCFRCEEIHEVLNNSEILYSKFEHYTKKIRWHIQRLYRIRNEITHSAFNENKSLVIYIEHLYSYLSQLMSEIVHYIVHKEAQSVDEAYATITENYNTYMELIKEGRMNINEILENGIIEF